MKHAFPGDAEFTAENYSSLSWGYVVSAVRRALDMRHKDLHAQERPTAMLSSLFANSNRDPKKSQKGYSYLDFSFYKPLQNEDVPQSHYGSAYSELIKKGRLPSWALFCFKSLMSSVDEGYVPPEAAFISEDAILLHPERIDGGWRGLLIAMESASDQRRAFEMTNGEIIHLTVPYIHTKLVAQENAILPQ